MKKILKNILVIACLGLLSLPAVADVNLPKVSVAGQEYYVYESKKGDSLYGISNRFGWNVDRLLELNPTLTSNLKKGSKVYYPASKVAVESESSPLIFSAESYPVIQHVVKKGDSVYSIAAMYGVPVDKIYMYNPDTKNGLKRGSIVTIPQSPDEINSGESFFFYAIRPGDTLNSIAETYNTSVQQLLHDNKGVSDANFEAGDLLRISVNSKKDTMMTLTVDETKMDHIDTYTASKDDTWESVAEKTGADVDQLKDMNAGVELKKNAHIDVPVVVTSQVEREMEYVDERENTAGGIQEIYKDVHNIGNDDPAFGNVVNVALLIEDPQSKRDNEFTRGALLALDRMKNSPYKIRFKLLQDSKAYADSVSAVKALMDSLDGFSPDLVVTTHEKNFPLWLAQYGEKNGVEIVNSFDVKSELYLQNPSMIHLLTPTPYFSEAVAEWVGTTFPDYKLIMVGKKDADDAYAEEILSKTVATPQSVALEDLGEMTLDDWGKYLIYGYPTSREDVSTLLNAVGALKEANPLATVKVMGRPSWITFADDQKEKFETADVYFPSRFFFDHQSDDGRKFISDYSASFGHGPIRAFPTYAASGYDIMNYFVESLAKNDGDFNVTVSEVGEIQNPINLQRVGNWGGLYNPSAYIIRYAPLGEVEKILIRK